MAPGLVAVLPAARGLDAEVGSTRGCLGAVARVPEALRVESGGAVLQAHRGRASHTHDRSRGPGLRLGGHGSEKGDQLTRPLLEGVRRLSLITC